MGNSVTPMELYDAARETCMRLYVANGGDPKAVWKITTTPDTAAIACEHRYGKPPVWTLAMPAFPLDARLPKWKGELIAAYTVHELLHALWTDWEAVRQSARDGLHGLQNALEDCRIEARASRGDLVLVKEARRLLEALNDYIARRAMASPDFRLDDPKQFSFVLGLVIFEAKLGYKSPFPADWRARVNPNWFPLFDLALAKFDGLNSTGDVVALARDLKALADTITKPAPEPAIPVSGVRPPEREIVEPELTPLDMETIKSGAPPKIEGDKSEGEAALEPLGSPAAPASVEMSSDTPSPENAVGEASNANGEALDDVRAGDAPGETASSGETKPAKPETDLSDATQAYDEASLNDLSREAAKDAGRSLESIQYEASSADTIFNTPSHEQTTPTKGGDSVTKGSVISSPAKLKRHLTMAVKSPERVAHERRQVSGRLDVRDHVAIATGRTAVFRRRVEEEGREAAVTVLLDISSSMKGRPIAAARAMALHMGDALKAAGVRFEIAAFDDAQLVTAKPFAKGWNNETKRHVAGLHAAGGTRMMPAMRDCAKRLLAQGGVTRRILLALTDGQDGFPSVTNQALCRHMRQRGVEIVGISLMAGDLSQTFDGKSIQVRNPDELSRSGLKLLISTLAA